MDRDPKGYYARLFVTPDASDEEIKRKYRRLAKRFHPDANPGDEDAAEEFKKIQEAYETLSEPKKRAIYDQHAGGGQTQGPPPQWQKTWSATPPPRPKPPPPPPRQTPPPKSSPPKQPPPQPTPQVSGSKRSWMPLYVGAAVVVLIWFFGFRGSGDGVTHQPGVNWAVKGSSFVDSNQSDTNFGACNSYTLTKSLLVYTDGNKDRVLALDRATGKKRWSLDNYLTYGDCPALAREVGGSLIYDDDDADSGTGLIRVDPMTGQGDKFSDLHFNYIIGNTGIEAASDHTAYYSLPAMSQIASSTCSLGTCPEGFLPGAFVTSQEEVAYSGVWVTKLTTTEGETLWSHKSSAAFKLLGYDNDLLVFYELTHGAVALDRKTGKEVWSVNGFPYWAVPAGKYFLVSTTASNNEEGLVSISRARGSRHVISYNGTAVEAYDDYVVATKGGKSPQAIVRTGQKNWRVNLRTGRAVPLIISSQDLSDASVNFLEAGDSKDLIVLQQSSNVLMSVKW